MPRTKSTKGRDDFQPVDSMDPRVVQNMQDIAVFHRSNLEKNVQLQYNGKNKQWGLFCDHMNFSTGRTVTPANAAVYIYDWILRLPNDHSRQPNEPHPAVKDKQAENDQAMQSNNEEDEFASEEFTSEERTQLMAEVNNVEEFVKLRKELGYDDADAGLQRLLACSQSSSSILGYVAALVNLWECQKAMGLNSFPTPRTKAVNSILRAIDRVRNARRILNFEDMGDDLYYDGIGTVENMKRIFLHYLHRNTFEALRDLTAQAIGIYGLLRAGDQLKTTLASLSLKHFPDEGPTPCYGVVITIREGKTNHEGKVQYANLLRNKHVDQCPVSFLALMLFARFHFSGEDFPNSNTSFPSMKSRRDWYPIPLFVTPQTNHSRLKYATLNASVRQALLACDIHCKASTHTSRKWGAQLAEQGGAPEEEIARHGRWCTGVMETTYLSHFPLKAMRVLAGFPKKKGAYHLSRDIHVPKELADQVFPWLDNAEVELSDSSREEDDKAGRAFVDLLRYLATVVVQDAPFLRRLVPDLYVWKHPVFSKPSYVAFEAKALAEAEIASTTASEIMRRGMPELTGFLSTNFKAVFGALRQIDAKEQDTNASLVELRKTVLEERRSERYDALLAGIGDAFYTIARDLRHKGPSGAPTDPSTSTVAASSSVTTSSSVATTSSLATSPSLATCYFYFARRLHRPASTFGSFNGPYCQRCEGAVGRVHRGQEWAVTRKGDEPEA
ncbi:Hypothetical protein CGB_J1690W [Cryptococcus gattii WM276]|uniref:Ndc10 domain-containing protein n=1 Tax=Cryptococcus gattii serotype B (strain WM276 / ATCC MYA-4071) TaxID=367775 RepID=E6RCV6_CRYGW|nr:Hypothetical protein CGB_J1690W [Cryptococcus gattii WM276]ADV24725.1 Hypothetical protein CGB_J1690W [Cryptococcus gattii WM276]KJE00715.1 hypothetical protein I311_05685 [Cryptococcus gattii NT-10]